MARPLRIDYPGAFHHIMNRGTNRTPIFQNQNDRAIFLQTLRETVRQWKIRVHAYSLMDNHYHLLIETPLANLSRAMRHLDGVYTQRFNRKYDRDGALMRGRFKSILVEHDSYFLELVRYIHLNGVRALVYPAAALDPNCSHRHYLNPSNAPAWLTRDITLDFFQNAPRGAALALDTFVGKGISDELRKTLDGKRWPALLGTKTFIKNIRDGFVRKKPVEPEQPQEKPLRRLARPRRVIRAVMTVFRVGFRDIVARPSSRGNEARRAAIYFLRRASHLTYRQIGKLMGDLRRSYLSRICRRQNEQIPDTWKKVAMILEGKGET